MLFGKKEMLPIVAPMNGYAVALEEIDDPVFANKIVGDGVAVVPTDSDTTVVAPVTGVVQFIGEKGQSYGIVTAEGIEVLLHIGIDTSRFVGHAFDLRVKKGDSVKAGDPLCDVNLTVLRDNGFDLTTPLVITANSMSKVKRLTLRSCKTEAGTTVCMRYQI